MQWDDVVYLTLLFFSIGCGHYYRKIESKELKKSVGSLIGLGIIVIVSGFHILHVFIVTLVNIIIILFLNKKQCHLISFTFSFLYLLFFRTTIYFGIPYAPAHTNLIIMMLTLKLVGLAFEVNSCYLNGKKNKDELDDEVVSEYELNEIYPSCMDIIHYVFNYVGILTGPYYSYRTFWDSIYKPFVTDADCESATKEAFKYVPLYAVLFLASTYIWPLSYALSDEFYDERSLMYRVWYVIPIFWTFRFRLYIGILLSVCVCTMAGIGGYPKFSNPKSGRGPSTNFSKLKKMDKHELQNEKYDFGTIQNIAPYDVEFCTTFRDAMKYWNMTVQFWMANCIYKRFPNKQFRTLATLLVSSFWHGVYIGHYFCISGAPFYLAVEDIYVKLYLKDSQGLRHRIWSWIIWASKMTAFSYLGMAFQLLTIERVMKFYNSIYHVGSIAALILYCVGMMNLKTRPRCHKNE